MNKLSLKTIARASVPKAARLSSSTTVPPTNANAAEALEGNQDHMQYNFDIMRRALTPAPTPHAEVRNIGRVEGPLVPMDGNQAAAYVAYGMSETSFIYPISPATSMGEHMDTWSSQGKKNCMGQSVRVNTMQSEHGAAGACHGAVAGGVLTTTFTASQGLLLMIPNLYLLAGELMPIVLHVSARTVAKHALSIFNDHSDVMACRQTGFAQLCSNSVQEVMDLGFVAHLATLRSRIPFMHFFDGYRTSAEISKIETIPYSAMTKLMPYGDLQRNLRDLALNPQHPIVRGTGQRPDIFFQASVAAGRYYQACPDVVEACMEEVAHVTGRHYNLFDYVGSKEATHLIVMMGSAGETTEEVIEFLQSQGDNSVGLIKVRLYRPWSSKRFLELVSPSIKRITVLDRTREDGAQGNPLHLDVQSTILDSGRNIPCLGGVYGLASKEYTPSHVKAVIDNMQSEQPRMRFVVGIDDDITNSSLPVAAELASASEGTKQCMFWGLGGDGTIGANKAAIKNLALDAGLEAQAYFNYDSHKEMGCTVSHLRFGTNPIKGHYMIVSGADYVACHHPSYVKKYDLLAAIKEDGIFVVNCPWQSLDGVERNFSNRVKRDIAQRNVKLVTINATALALELGLGMRINTLMQSCFYQLSGVLPVDEALELLKKSIVELYSKKGPDVVNANQKAVDAAITALTPIDYPRDAWAQLEDNDQAQRDLFDHVNIPTKLNALVDEFVHNIMDPVLSLEGDKLPVSSFVPGGPMPTSTCKHERRGLAAQVPVWHADNCTQCNYCVIVCPHAVIRPFLLDRNEHKAAPKGFEARKATGGAEYAGLLFTIQLATEDCTGCAVCVQSCPDDALHMEPYEQVSPRFLSHWEYAVNLPSRNPADMWTVKGSQFQQPLLEFSGACPGCGETPYVSLLTRLFGEKMMIANASGCSSVWGGTATTHAYTTTEKGRGPAWARSLFEDNAEFGFGMAMATQSRRQKARMDIEEALASPDVTLALSLRTALTNLVESFDNYDKADRYVTVIEKELPAVADQHPALGRLVDSLDMLRPQSQWIIGGDGWAYDIGFGGLDHVLASGENVNVLVLDTEMYSNTGGQVSKSTQKSTVLKFAQSGKSQMKKDLGVMAMSYGTCYVGSVALGANYNQCLQAFKEAESFEGPSLLLCYAPCIDWGIDMQYMMDSMKIAVDTGYWKLYRYDPRLAAQGKIPLQLDSPKIKSDVRTFLETQNRFKQLVRKDADKASHYFNALSTTLGDNHEHMKRSGMDNMELLDHLKGLVGEAVSGEKVLVLYASETGTAEEVGKMLVQEMKRRHVRAKGCACDDYDFENLPNESKVVIIGATCGQGEYPANSKAFWKALSDPSLPSDFLGQTEYAVFSLGDSSYVYFNKVGKDIDERFAELGATRITANAMANEKDDEKWETAWSDFIPTVWQEWNIAEPPAVMPEPNYSVEVLKEGGPPVDTDRIMPSGTKLVPMNVSNLESPVGYERDIRHYEFDLSGTGVMYNLGDSLGVYPYNQLADVHEFLKFYGLNPTDKLVIKDFNDSQKYPSVVTAEVLFQQTADIFGRPNRRFYEMMALYSTDPVEAEEIRYLMSKDGAADFKTFLKETPTFFDILQKWQSARFPLEYLLDFLPPIRPRLYSIASAPDVDGDNLQLCIVADDWVTPSDRLRHGLTTNYLKNLTVSKAEPEMVACRVNNAAFSLPKNHKQPMVMVALGTGIAPIRAVIRDRLLAKEQGEEVGPMALFFGVRNKANEYTYGEWIDAIHDNGNGPLTINAPAFSRDQKEKIYVQHRLAEHTKTIHDWIVNQDGYYLLCGPSGPPCEASRQAVISSLVEHSGGAFDAASAEQYVTDMQIEGRFNEEVW